MNFVTRFPLRQGPRRTKTSSTVQNKLGNALDDALGTHMNRILTIDGGGMRGYIPAAVLVELEQLAGRPCWQMFDLIAGTSIGGILAALLAAGVPAGEAIKFFTEDGPNIFRKIWWRSFGLLAPRYPAQPLESALQARFGGRRISDCKTKLLVVSLDLVSQNPFFFENFSGCCPNYPLWQAGRGTSAAQTYFPAFHLDGMILWDGGNVANNPSVCAMADAVKLWGDHALPRKVLSLGCGNQKAGFNARKMVNAGLIRNGLATLQMLFEAGAEDVDYQMQQALGPNYFRIQPVINDLPLDDASPGGLERLERAARRNISDSSDIVKRFLA